MNGMAPDSPPPRPPEPGAHLVRRHWLTSERGWLAQMAAFMQARQAHPARTVVLLPYAQLMPVAARLWAQSCPEGFAPRFETTQNWSRSLGDWVPAATDIAFDVALDVLTAQALLERAGLGDRSDALATGLVEAAHQLGALAAAVLPEQRQAWAARARGAILHSMQADALALESAMAQMAVAWAASSGYASDVLFTPEAASGTDCLIALQGFQPDPLLASLQSIWGVRMGVIALDAAEGSQPGIAFHAARDAQDEAQRAAACVLRHVNAGRAPVALIATDRALTRRVRAMLAASGLTIRDENGWKLSTSRAGAHVMGALRACVWNASSDSVLDWLKNAPAFDAAAVRQLEAQLRRKPVREWRAGLSASVTDQPMLATLLTTVQTLRDGLQRARTLPQWLSALRELLQHSGQWALLLDDVAGDKLLAVLRLTEAASAPGAFAETLWAQRRLSLSDFSSWVNQALEGASFTPVYPLEEQVVILPLAQMLGRPFAAAVLPGCDEVRLNPSPEPPGIWTAAQREALGLPARATLQAALRAAWQHALLMPQVDLLWRGSDDGGEPLLPSALVQALRLRGGHQSAPDPRAQREVAPALRARPAPVAPALTVQKLSASAYNDLRQCPYRFFALRQLGLKEADELEGELDKRDFGLWLHAVLKAFHDRLKASLAQDEATRLALMEDAVVEVNAAQQLAEEEFLPFMAAWPRVRAGYLEWLARYEAGGARFDEAERWQEQPLGPITLIGRLDRIDQVPASEEAPAGVMVIDYKTESPGVTRERIKAPFEDTQLAFYAALQPNDTLRAAYVNVGERDGTQLFEQKDVVAVRDALIEGIVHDMDRISGGAALPALGEGMACEFCAARGLCRKDSWNVDAVRVEPVETLPGLRQAQSDRSEE